MPLSTLPWPAWLPLFFIFVIALSEVGLSSPPVVFSSSSSIPVLSHLYFLPPYPLVPLPNSLSDFTYPFPSLSLFPIQNPLPLPSLPTNSLSPIIPPIPSPPLYLSLFSLPLSYPASLPTPLLTLASYFSSSPIPLLIHTIILPLYPFPFFYHPTLPFSPYPLPPLLYPPISCLPSSLHSPPFPSLPFPPHHLIPLPLLSYPFSFLYPPSLFPFSLSPPSPLPSLSSPSLLPPPPPVLPHTLKHTPPLLPSHPPLQGRQFRRYMQWSSLTWCPKKRGGEICFRRGDKKRGFSRG